MNSIGKHIAHSVNTHSVNINHTEKNQTVLEKLTNDVLSELPLTDSERVLFQSKIRAMFDREVNILFVGATGSGKSSTINAIFDTSVAKVGTGTDPETMDVNKYQLDSLTIWDSPGLGDGIQADDQHADKLRQLLRKESAPGEALIDLVVVILDASSKDLGTSIKLINRLIIPELGDQTDRLLIALNQADVAMKGRSWNHETNRPEPRLQARLEELAKSIQHRIFVNTDVLVEPVYYSAGFTDEFETQKPWNICKLFSHIMMKLPKGKRPAVRQTIDSETLESDTATGAKDDRDKAEQSFWDDVWERVKEVAMDIGKSYLIKGVTKLASKAISWLGRLF